MLLMMLIVALSQMPSLVIDAQGIRYEFILNRILSKGVTPNNNSFVLIVKAIGPEPYGSTMPNRYFQALGIDKPPRKGDYVVGLETFVEQRKPNTTVDYNQLNEMKSTACSTPWSAEKYPELVAWLMANAKPLDHVKQGVTRSRYYNPILPIQPNGILLTSSMSCQSCRVFMEMFIMRSMLRLHQNQLDESWDDILACHRLGRHLMQGGTLSEWLLGNVCEQSAGFAVLQLLQSDKLTLEHLTTWQAELAQLPKPKPLTELLDMGERYSGLRVLQSLKNDPTDRPVIFPNDVELSNVDWEIAVASYNQLNDRLVDQAGRPYHKRKSINLVPTPKPMSKWMRTFLSPKERGARLAKSYFHYFNSSFNALLNADCRFVQRRVLEQTAIALAIHKNVTGNYPRQLSELKLTSERIDLTINKPLKYTPSKTGYQLRSVGPDRKPSNDDLIVTVPIPNENE